VRERVEFGPDNQPQPRGVLRAANRRGEALVVVRRVGVWSAARVSGLLYALLGLVIGGLFSVFALVGAAIGAAASAAESPEGALGSVAGALFGLGAVVVLPIFYGLLGLVGGALSAAFYNLAAGWVGGIELDLQ
jgi:hypothetical protein